MYGTLKQVMRVIAYGAVGVVLTLLTVLVLHLNGRPDLSAWHTVHLDEEFTKDSGLESFREYLDLEQRLFQQLDDEVYAETPTSAGNIINRFSKGSLSDPDRWPQNWNRSYELEEASSRSPPRSVVLLLHGLSDSPYSLRHMARTLHEKGSHVLAIRLPGHGTAPSGLAWATWQDMAAAVRLAIKHLHQQHPDIPVQLVGYSNGAALALNYELATLTDASLPKVERHPAGVRSLQIRFFCDRCRRSVL